LYLVRINNKNVLSVTKIFLLTTLFNKINKNGATAKVATATNGNKITVVAKKWQWITQLSRGVEYKGRTAHVVSGHCDKWRKLATFGRKLMAGTFHNHVDGYSGTNLRSCSGRYGTSLLDCMAARGRGTYLNNSGVIK